MLSTVEKILNEQRVNTALLERLRGARRVLRGMPEPEAAALAGRCDRLLTKIERGQYRTHCEVSRELRDIINHLEGMLQ